MESHPSKTKGGAPGARTAEAEANGLPKSAARVRGWPVLSRSEGRGCSAAALLASTLLRFQALDLKEWSEQKRVEKLRYIHRNPVKRGLVERPEDWLV